MSPVLDSDGDAVTPENEYYISNAGAGFHGGIGLPKWSRLRCPSSVIQMRSETQLGLPVNVEPVYRYSTSPQIYVNQTTVQISFSEPVTGCLGGEGYWRVEYDEEAEKTLVVAGILIGVQLSSQFRIVQAGQANNVYTFVSCSRLKCRDEIGLYAMDHQQHLSVNDQPNELPYTFKFIKKKAENGIQLPK
ncbi:factor Xa inhibitor BuXI-like [Andrographis paniculata]|uniref:factor Xa inhibitor BuXI-like n=1 Tax=Andrographis paniculata TaxID=175694 RepID=UPI0021E6DE92|nr:factor Xa inhibitor BuXI-like [Andrographis paniculata]